MTINKQTQYYFFICVSTLILICTLGLASAAQQTYQSTNDDRCIYSNVTALESYSSIKSGRQCATKCLINANCAMFMMTIASETCSLFTAMYYYKYLTVSYYKPKTCTVWYAYWARNAKRFTSTATFNVPDGVRVVKVLAVGGGSGACGGNDAAGGSGYVAFAMISVNGGQIFQVTVGQGGSGNAALSSSDCTDATNGTFSAFGNVVAAGGETSSANDNWNSGGSGGSGGGSSTSKYYGATFSGSGGSAGSDGTGGSTSYLGGKGQGTSFTSSFSQFTLTKISAGSGAAGLLGSPPYGYGGGGAGGVLLNGTGPSAGAGGCCPANPLYCGPVSATGYGASGSAGCRASGYYSSGGDGADGVVYIEYY